MDLEGRRQQCTPPPLYRDVLRLAFASRTSLEQRPDLRDMGREKLAELTLQQIERDALPPEVLDTFSPACAYFRSQAAAIPDQDGQRRLAAAEVSSNRDHALPAALAGLSLTPDCRALAAEQLLALTDERAKQFSDLVTKFNVNESGGPFTSLMHRTLSSADENQSHDPF